MKRKIELSTRAVCGGSWLSGDPAYLAASARGWGVPTYRFDSMGFRLVRKL